MKFDLLYRSRWWLLYGPILLLAALLLWLSYTQWLPAPPQSFTIAAGQPGDGYTQLALRYRERLASMGIDAQVLTTDSAHEAVKALMSEPPRAQMALASGLHASAPWQQSNPGAASLPELANIQGLAVIEREPVWIFSRTPLMTRISELRNLRVGIPANDSLADRLAQLLMQNAGLQPAEIRLVRTPRLQIANQLIDGQLDAVIVQASAQSEAVRVLTRSPFIHLIGVDQVRGLLQREQRLRPFVLPQGVIEFRGDIPPRDLTMEFAACHSR
jgi:TRAP-type uncharacterized transport system substrate-binding protein